VGVWACVPHALICDVFVSVKNYQLAYINAYTHAHVSAQTHTYTRMHARTQTHTHTFVARRPPSTSLQCATCQKRSLQLGTLPTPPGRVRTSNTVGARVFVISTVFPFCAFCVCHQSFCVYYFCTCTIVRVCNCTRRMTAIVSAHSRTKGWCSTSYTRTLRTAGTITPSR
jgi:hypothetical protein